MLRNFIPRANLLTIMSSTEISIKAKSNKESDAKNEHKYISLLSYEWYSAVEGAAMAMTPDNVIDIPIERQLGYLYMVEAVIKLIGFGFTEHIQVMSHLVYVILLSNYQLGSIQDSLTSTVSSVRETDGDDHDENTLHDSTSTNELADAEQKGIISSQSQRNKLRPMCFLRLKELVEQYHTVYDFSVLAGNILESISGLIQKMPSAMVGSDRPPALLKLLNCFANQPKCIDVVLDNVEVVKSVINCLAVKTTGNVTQMIIDTVLRFVDHLNGFSIRPFTQVSLI